MHVIAAAAKVINRSERVTSEGMLMIDWSECRLRRFELIELGDLVVDIAGRVVECLYVVVVVVVSRESGGGCDNFSLSKK